MKSTSTDDVAPFPKVNFTWHVPAPLAFTMTYEEFGGTAQPDPGGIMPFGRATGHTEHGPVVVTTGGWRGTHPNWMAALPGGGGQLQSPRLHPPAPKTTNPSITPTMANRIRHPLIPPLSSAALFFLRPGASCRHAIFDLALVRPVAVVGRVLRAGISPVKRSSTGTFTRLVTRKTLAQGNDGPAVFFALSARPPTRVKDLLGGTCFF
jgi:hypothetical protein